VRLKKPWRAFPNSLGTSLSACEMYHFAWEMDSFEALDQLHSRLIAKGAKIAGYSESQNSANVMFFDPEGNEIEAIWEPGAEELARVKEADPVPQLTRAI